MRLFRHPAFYLIGSNFILWGIPLAVIQLQSLYGPRQLIADFPVPSGSERGKPAEVLAQLQPPLDLPRPQQTSAKSIASPPPSDAVKPASAPESVADLPSKDHPIPNLMQQLSGADGLGGPITLSSLREPSMPVAARAERLQQKRSGDPLAALPRHWRDSLRQELASGPAVSEASIVRLPVPALKERQEVPVIVNERGEGNGLVTLRDERARAAVESWAGRQVAAAPGTVQVYVVAAEPIPDVLPGSPAPSIKPD
jgi:hypothetical protein